MSVRAYAPGRTEIAGNHTDHQGGRVIAGAVSCGVEVELVPNASPRARVRSAGFDPFELDVSDLAPHAEERGTSAALVRGVVAGLARAGIPPRGFDAHVTSSVPAGGGLSSSAAFELALACALVEAACGQAPAAQDDQGSATHGQAPAARGEGSAAHAATASPCGYAPAAHDASPLSPVALARIAQAAERDYFGKPCGLMDQLAVALGGIALIDFAGEEPVIERIDFDFEERGLALCLIDVHCDHSRYTHEYAQVARDMDDVARLLGAQVLSQVAEGKFLARFGEVRRVLGDVAAMRALHYYHENRLVDARAQALREGDVEAFLAYTRQSGASSAQYLQNVSTYDRESQPAMVVLALADVLLAGTGAARIHGGGFGGTVQAYVPLARLEQFTEGIDKQLGAGSCRAYTVGGAGARLLT